MFAVRGYGVIAAYQNVFNIKPKYAESDASIPIIQRYDKALENASPWVISSDKEIFSILTILNLGSRKFFFF